MRTLHEVCVFLAICVPHRGEAEGTQFKPNFDPNHLHGGVLVMEEGLQPQLELVWHHFRDQASTVNHELFTGMQTVIRGLLSHTQTSTTVGGPPAFFSFLVASRAALSEEPGCSEFHLNFADRLNRQRDKADSQTTAFTMSPWQPVPHVHPGCRLGATCCFDLACDSSL